ncbi:MAG TPA: hypothetical protein VMA75_01715 [Candidatus Paceibacterota bacterium]|nr:hypothetical protein [Candidatus Paceibacterota bacterium]
MKKILPIFFTVAALIVPWRSFAAVITVGPSGADPQTVAITLDTQGEEVNAVEIHFSFDTDLFSVKGISTGGSVINLWVNGPSFSNTLGTVDLAGIIPGGEVTASGTIVTITLVPKLPQVRTNFTFDSGQVLLNDGKGTPAALSVVINPFTLGGAGSAPPAESTKAPNAFAPEIGQDPDIFGGSYFLVFSTTDQQSGIDHYDVLEVPAGTKVTSSSPWVTAASPYLLKDQELSSDIYVRAVDAAGNFRTEKISAAHPRPGISATLSILEAILGAIVVLLIGAGIVRRIRQWKKRKR